MNKNKNYNQINNHEIVYYYMYHHINRHKNDFHSIIRYYLNDHD